MQGWLSRKIAARRLGVSPQRVSQLARAGTLDATHDDEGWLLVSERTVDAYLSRRAEPVDPREAAARRRDQAAALKLRRERAARREEERAEHRKWRRDVARSLADIARALAS